MADEAVVRILVQEGGSTTNAAGTPSSKTPAIGAPSASSAQVPVSWTQDQKTRDRLDTQLLAEALAWAKIQKRKDEATDKYLKHQERLMLLEVKAETDRILKAKGAAERAEKAEVARKEHQMELFDLAAKAYLAVVNKQQAVVATENLERDREIDARRRKLEEEQAEQNKRELEIVKVKLRAARVAAEMDRAAIPNAEVVFDPKYEAVKRHGRKLEAQGVDEEYEKLYGQPKKADKKDAAGGNLLFDILKALRGTIGGMGSSGRAVGSMLDMSAAAKGGAVSGAGMAGAAIALGKMVVDAVIGGIKGVANTVTGVGTSIASADADPGKQLADLGEATSQVSATVTQFGFTLGIAGVVAGETAKSLGSLMQAIDKTAERYGEYSPQIAQAQAIAEIRQTMGDFRRAQEVGGEMAKYLMAQSDLQQKFEDVKVKLLVKILPLVTSAVQILEAIMPSGQGIEDAVSGVAAPLTALAQIMSEIANMIRDDRVPTAKDPTEQLSDPMFRTPGAGARGLPGLVPRL